METERPGAVVSSLHCHDLSGDGELDLIVGRDDGSLEVYATSGIPELLAEGPGVAYRRYTYVCNSGFRKNEAYGPIACTL